jgi:DivIVA domain-containing protein
MRVVSTLAGMGSDFTIVLRGYAIAEVDRVLALADQALASGSEALRASARAALEAPDFGVGLRGYDRDQVDHAVEHRLARLGSRRRGKPGGAGNPGVTGGAGPAAADFTIALRGYDMTEVDQALAEADKALASGSATVRAYARDKLRQVRFRHRFRGYARHQVDRAVEHRLSRLG